MATGENQQTLSPLWQSPLRSRTPSGLRYVCLGHTLTLVSMERFSVVRQSAGKPTRPFLCGGRDLLGQCRGLEGDVLPCASHGAWCNLRAHSKAKWTLSAHAHGFRHTPIYCLTHRHFWTAPASQTPNARGVPDQVRTI